MKRSVQTRSAATCTLCAVAVCFGIFAWVWQGWAYIQHLWVTVEIPQLHYEGLHTDAKEVYMAMSGTKPKLRASGRFV